MLRPIKKRPFIFVNNGKYPIFLEVKPKQLYCLILELKTDFPTVVDTSFIKVAEELTKLFAFTFVNNEF